MIAATRILTVFNSPRNVALLVAIPCFVWLCVSLGFYIKSFFPPEALKKERLTSVLYWVGQRSFAEIETEVLDRVEPGVWKGKSLKILASNDPRRLRLELGALLDPVELTYDGQKWRGYTHIPTRILPVVFEVR